MAKSQRSYLLHIHDALEPIRQYSGAGRDAFHAESMRQDAIVRNLEIVGEATKCPTEQTRALASQVPWKQIAGMRDVLVHEYFGVDLNIVWQVVEDHLDTLQSAVEELLADEAVS